MKLITTLIASALLTSCDSDRKPATASTAPKSPEPTSNEVIDDLIAKGLIRVDINFLQVRSSPEFKNDKHMRWSDSEIACSLDLHNFSKEDLRLDIELFKHYTWIEILRVSDGEQAAMLSPHRSADVRPTEYFDLSAETTKTFGIQYEAFECFHGIQSDDGGVRYNIFPGDFVIFHKRFPSDRLEFSVDEEGIVRPKFDMKIQDDVKTKPELGDTEQPSNHPESKSDDSDKPQPEAEGRSQ